MADNINDETTDGKIKLDAALFIENDLNLANAQSSEDLANAEQSAISVTKQHASAVEGLNKQVIDLNKNWKETLNILDQVNKLQNGEGGNLKKNKKKEESKENISLSSSIEGVNRRINNVSSESFYKANDEDIIGEFQQAMRNTRETAGFLKEKDNDPLKSPVEHKIIEMFREQLEKAFGKGSLGEELEKLINKADKAYGKTASAKTGKEKEKYESEYQRVSNLISEKTALLTEQTNTVNRETKNRIVNAIDNGEFRDKLSNSEYREVLKKSWWRNKEQRTDYLELGKLEGRFKNTGNFRESFKETAFNRLTGMKQRQGVTGFAANLGYKVSGMGLGLIFGGAATALVNFTKGVVDFAKEATVAYGEIQSIKTNLGIVSGSQAEADQTFSEIAAYSIKSPFGVQTVSEFAVLLKQSGVYASDLMDTLKQIGDVAGGNQEKFGNIANAFSQIEANGKATTRQLRQFATAGIPVYKELSKELGVGIDQIRKMTEQGQISSQIIEKIFSNMTGAGGTFENAVNIGAKTWKARQQNLADAKQLAQAAVGEWLINAGGTGRNDSIAETILSFKEGFYQLINDIATVKNIDRNVNKIATQDTKVDRLTKELELLEKGGATQEVIQLKKEQIKEAASVISDDMQRSYAKTAYETAMSRYEGKLEISDSEYKEIEKTLKKMKNMYNGLSLDIDENGKQYVSTWNMNGEMPEKVSTGVTPEQFKTAMAAIANLEYKLDNSYKKSDKDKDYEKVKDLEGKTNIANAIESLKGGYELLDKSINKNPYDPKNKTGFYGMNQESISKYNQTEEGKRKLEEEERANWETMRSLWADYAKYIDESGRLMKNFSGTATEALEMMTSGIITPLDNISLAPEDLAKDWIGLINLSGDEKTKKEEELDLLTDEVIGKFKDQSTVIMNFSDTTESTRQSLIRFMGSLGQAGQLLKSGQGVQGAELLATAYNDVMSDLQKYGQLDAAKILSMATTRTSRTAQAKSWTEINPSKSNSKDTYPLWQRILNQSFGTSLELFKNGAITRGDQAVNLWATQQKREGIKNMSRSMLNTMNYKDVMSNLAYSGGNYVIGNTSKIGVTQIDWDKTYKNFSTFSMSLESAAEVTRAYSDSLQSDVDTLRDFMSSAFTITEDAANVYDPEYQKHLGELSKNIKALDANAYDMMFEVDKDSGMIKLRENATSAAQALLDEKQTMLAFADATATAKESIESMNKEIRGVTLNRDINLGKYRRTALMKGMTSSEQQKYLEEVQNIIYSDTYKPILDEKKLSPENFIMSFAEDYESMEEAYRNYTVEEDSRKSESLSITIAKLETELKELEKNALKTYIVKETNIVNAKGEADRNDYEKRWANYSTDNEKMKDAERQLLKGNIKTTEANLYYKAKNELDSKRAELEALDTKSDESAKGMNDLIKSLIQLKDAILDFSKATKEELFSQGFKNLTNDNIEEGKVDRDFLRSIIEGDEVSSGNTRRQQHLLDYMGIEKGYTFSDVVRTTYKADKGDYFKDFIKSFTKDELLGYDLGNKEVINTLSGLNNGENFGDIVNNLVDYGTLDSLESLLEYLGNIRENADFLENSMLDLGKTFKDTLQGSLLDGLNNSFVTMGNHVRDIVSATGEAVDSAKDYAEVWKNVAQSMLSSLGPALTQAGLAIITHDTKNWKVGAMMVAAGGVLSFMSGLFGNDEENSKDEENRIKTLRDLLADLIAQAKTDAEYYTKNLRHENALSEANQISVNDAIITPNGNVVSTHPDDYLIATKTPGALIGAGGKGDTVVNFTMVDQSTGQKNVRTEQRENSDGSVDIIAYVTDAVSSAIADGKMDNAFAAREYRLNGNSYTS